MSLITRNGLPSRHSVDGFKQLCVDDVGFARLEDLKARFVGKVKDGPETRAMLRKEMKDLLTMLKHQGHLFRKDGDPLL